MLFATSEITTKCVKTDNHCCLYMLDDPEEHCAMTFQSINQIKHPKKRIPSSINPQNNYHPIYVSKFYISIWNQQCSYRSYYIPQFFLLPRMPWRRMAVGGSGTDLSIIELHFTYGQHYIKYISLSDKKNEIEVFSFKVFSSVSLHE